MWDLINKSKRDSLVLMILFLFFTLTAISAIGFYLMYYYGFLGVIFIFVASFYVIFHTLHSYLHSSEIALKAVKAIPLDEMNYPPSKKQYIKDTVEALSIAAGIKSPKIYIMHSSMINAFATGKDPQHAAICLTTGAIEKLNREELEGVIGHEIGHIVNADIMYMTFAAVLLSFLITLGNIGLRLTFFRNERRAGVIILIGLLFAILAPIFGKIIQSAISRQREYLADATSAKLTRNPNELISALKKIEIENKNLNVRIPSKVVSLMIWEPRGLFATHPPIEKRIKRLLKMVQEI